MVDFKPKLVLQVKSIESAEVPSYEGIDGILQCFEFTRKTMMYFVHFAERLLFKNSSSPEMRKMNLAKKIQTNLTQQVEKAANEAKRNNFFQTRK